MKLLELLRLSVRSITGHKLRSGLTTLGVIIGIAAVIAFVTLGASLQAGVIGEISPDDQRNLYGWAADPDVEGGPGAGAQPVFSERDLTAISDLDAVESAYGYAPLQTQGVTYEDEPVPLGDGVVSTGPSYVRMDRIEEGRQFEMGEREAVVNPAAAGQFETPVEVGDELTITLLGGQEMDVRVVGITDTSDGLSPFEGFEQSPRIYVPTDPYYAEQVGGVIGGPDDVLESSDGDAGERGGAEDVESNEGQTAGDADLAVEDDLIWFTAIIVEAPSPDDDAIEDAREASIAYLEGDESDASAYLDDDLAVSIETSAELLEQLQDVLELLQNFIVGIAAISLLVGAIGIANIMLVSVTERTREIGIMKAVGAQNRDVLGLFLAESIVLGVVGAILGTVLGLAAGYFGAWYVDLPLVYPFGYVLLAIAVGIAVGVLSGLYPAWRAARTDPIDALRYE